MDQLPAPKSLKFEQENLSETCSSWKQELKLFLQATKPDLKLPFY